MYFIACFAILTFTPAFTYGQSRDTDIFEETIYREWIPGRTVKVYLNFAGGPTYNHNDVIELYDPNKQPAYTGECGTDLVAKSPQGIPSEPEEPHQTIRTTGNYPYVELRFDEVAGCLGVYELEVRESQDNKPGSSNTVAKSIIDLVFLPPKPEIDSKRERITWKPNDDLEHIFNVTGGPFLNPPPKATYEGREVGVKVISHDTLQLTLKISASELEKAKRGDQDITISQKYAPWNESPNQSEPWEVYAPISIIGPEPRIDPKPGPIMADGDWHTIVLRGHHFGPNAKIRVMNDESGYEIGQLTYPAQKVTDNGTKLVTEIRIPEFDRDRKKGSFDLHIVNNDGQKSIAKISLNNPESRVTVKAKYDLIYEVGTSVDFKPKGGSPLFPNEGSYELHLGPGYDPIELEYTVGGDILQTSIALPAPIIMPRGNGPWQVDFTIKHDGDLEWKGVFSEVYRQASIDPITLRPGEKRNIDLRSNYPGYKLGSGSTANLTVVEDDMSDGSVTLEADKYASRQDYTIPILKGGRKVGDLSASVEDWGLGGAKVEWVSTDNDILPNCNTDSTLNWQELSTLDARGLNRSEKLFIRIDMPDSAGNQDQTAYVSFEKAENEPIGTKHRLTLEPGKRSECAPLELERSGLKGRDRFFVRVETPDGEGNSQRAFVRLKGFEKVSVTVGLSALVVPFHEDLQSYVLEGLQVGGTYQPNWLMHRSEDRLEFSFTFLLAKAQEVEGGAEPESGRGLKVGVGGGVEILDTITLGLGVDLNNRPRGFDVWNSRFLFVGFQADLADLSALLSKGSTD